MEATKTNRDWLIGKLKEGEVVVNFTKADGSERRLVCTLKADQLPPSDPAKKTLNKAVNEDVVSAWDVENEGWRSFRLDSIIGVSFEQV